MIENGVLGPDQNQDADAAETDDAVVFDCRRQGCGHRVRSAASLNTCPKCGWKRPGIAVAAVPFAFVVPSRQGPLGTPHVLQVHEDRFVGCTSCKAARFGKACDVSRAWQRRFRGQKDRQPMDLVPRKVRVFTILELFKDRGVRDDDQELVIHYVQYWHRSVPADMPWMDFLRWTSQLGFDLHETIRRRRAGIQNDDKLAPASPEVALDRAAKGHIRAPSVIDRGVAA